MTDHPGARMAPTPRPALAGTARALRRLSSSTLKRLGLGGHRIRFVDVDGQISLIQSFTSGACYFFPYGGRSAFNTTQLNILHNGFDAHLARKYSTDGFQVQPGETVIDCGGFVGGFSVAATKMGAGRVVYIEPTPLTRRCAALNFLLHGCSDRVSVHGVGLGQTVTEGILNLSASGADNSFLAPDEHGTGEAIEVEILTIDEIGRREDLDPSRTFAKIEAEGFEVEIVKGMNAFLPRVVTVDVTPERDGQSPRDTIRALLEQKGYRSFQDMPRCLFAAL